jgi:hypothetical protein
MPKPLLLAFLALSLLGCAAAPVCQAEYKPDPHPDVVLDVTDPGLLAAAECAAARWHRASGVRISATEGQGVARIQAPVAVTVDYVIGFEGEYDPVRHELSINRAIDAEWIFQVATHELGHALESEERSHLAWGVDGVMRGDVLRHESDFIGDADLELICGGEAPAAPCRWWRAER